MSMTQVVAATAITGGAFVMLLSVMKTRVVIGVVKTDDQKRNWRVQRVLMIFFLLGYLTALALVTSPYHDYLEAMTGVLFFAGALFVHLVVINGFGTMSEIESRVDKRTAELSEANRQLTAEMEARRHAQEREKQLAAERAKMEAERERARELEEAYRKLDAAHRELKSTQEQLVQSGKLAALGELAAGIVHELNQPITSIRGFSELLEMETDRENLDPGERADCARRIVRATDRMSHIVNNVRTFARQSDHRLAPISSAEPLEDALDLLSEQLRQHRIRVDKRIERDLPRVEADAIQMQQVFLNLLANARDALDEDETSTDKRISLSVAVEEGRVVYRVQDNGAGIPEGDADKIFDPFFTTKETDKGTGLGLSISYGIVKDHGGSIAYEPVPAGGARFTVRLPAIADAGADSGERGRGEGDGGRAEV
jgi:C4-dicarboxylate-specific signal transduction histidine kinase